MAVEAATPRLRKVALVARLSPLVIEPAHVLNAVGDQKESAQDVTLARRHLVAAVPHAARPEGALPLLHLHEVVHAHVLEEGPCAALGAQVRVRLRARLGAQLRPQLMVRPRNRAGKKLTKGL
eukprot:scaffold45833_cov37-Phaeocystis_antarctica.AAC.3